MRFLTDTLGVKLVTRQLPSESRSFLRALLSARGRPLPASWTPAPSAPEPARGAGSAAEMQHQDGSEDSDTPVQTVRPANGVSNRASDTVPRSLGDQPGFQLSAGQHLPPTGRSQLNGHASTSEQQQRFENNDSRRTEVNGLSSKHVETEAAPWQDRHVCVPDAAASAHLTEADASIAMKRPAMSYTALQCLMHSVSTALKHASPLPGQVETVGHETSDTLPPGL